MKARGIVVGVAVLAGIAVTGASAGTAEERSCRGTLNAITVDNLRVPQGATCVLRGTQIKGRLRILRGATLRATKILVVGNVQAENHAYVAVRRSQLGGSIQIVQGGGARLSANTIKGDIQLFENRRSLTVARNQVNGNLQCKENRISPTGGGNVVQGTKQDQCSRL